MTLLEIKNFVKTEFRESLSELDTLILNRANAAISFYSRLGNWRQLKVIGATITTTTAQSYDLPATFDRLLRDSVRYDTSSTTRGRTLESINDERFEAFNALGPTGAPMACMAGPKSGSTAFQLYLLPTFTETGKTITYDYIKKPLALSANTDSTQVPELDFAVCYTIIQGLAAAHEDYEAARYYSSEARAQYLNAVRSIAGES